MASDTDITRRTAAIWIGVGGLALLGGMLSRPVRRAVVEPVKESLAPKRIRQMTVHHTASPQVVGGQQVDAALLGEWHRKRGLGIGAGDKRDCAYHYVIHADGTIESARPLELPSAGTRSVKDNRKSLDVVLVGDFEPSDNRGRFYPARPTNAQLRSLDRVALWAAREYDFRPQRVRGHKEVTPGMTACPGKRMDTGAVRQRLTAALRDGRRASEPAAPTQVD